MFFFLSQVYFTRKVLMFCSVIFYITIVMWLFCCRRTRNLVLLWIHISQYFVRFMMPPICCNRNVGHQHIFLSLSPCSCCCFFIPHTGLWRQFISISWNFEVEDSIQCAVSNDIRHTSEHRVSSVRATAVTSCLNHLARCELGCSALQKSVWNVALDSRTFCASKRCEKLHSLP